MLSDKWLSNHPYLILGTEDYLKKKRNKKTLNSAQAIIEAAKMNVKSVVDFAN